MEKLCYNRELNILKPQNQNMIFQTIIYLANECACDNYATFPEKTKNELLYSFDGKIRIH